MTQDEMPWLLKDVFLLNAINLLVALPKAGKTSFVISMLAAYLRGDTDFIGKPFDVEQRPVLIIGTDQPNSDWARMLKRGQLLDENNRLHPAIIALFTSNSPMYLDEAGFSAIEKYCADYPGLIIILDCYARLTSPLGIEEKSEEYAYPLYKLADCVSRYSATVIVIHHSNKGEHGGSGVRCSRGTTAVPAACSQVVNLIRADNPGNIVENSSTKMALCDLHTDGRGGPQMTFKLKSTSDGWGLATDLEYPCAEKGGSNELTQPRAEASAYIHECWSTFAAGVSAKALSSFLGDTSVAGQKRAQRVLKYLHAQSLIDRTEFSHGYGKGRPVYLYIPTGIAKEYLKDIKDIEDVNPVAE